MKESMSHQQDVCVFSQRVALCALAVLAMTITHPGPARADVVDTDNDLMPDAWEQQWGFNPQDPLDANQDPDGDKLSNRDEYFLGTNPTVYTSVNTLSDRQVLNVFKSKAFAYFWLESRVPYYLTPDNTLYSGGTPSAFHSIATTGFGLMSVAMADERGWISHQAAYERIRGVLSRLVALQAPAYDVLGVPAAQQGNRHGYLYHFVDQDGMRFGTSEISTVDHGLLVAGALVAAEYYPGTEVGQLAHQLYLNTQWNWLYNGSFLAQGWIEDPAGTFEGGRTLDQWNRYSELLILLFEAMGHPDPAKAIPASAWDALTYGTGRMFPYEYANLVPGTAAQNFAFVPNMPSTLNAPGYTNSATELHYLHAGSLHNHQYSHLFADFRSRPDRYQTDFFSNSIAATMANRQFAINLNSHAFPDGSGQAQPYETYGPDSWGLMAGLTSFGYAVLQPIVMSYDNFSPSNIAANTDSGTVMLSAPLGSTPFTPRQAIDFTRNLLSRFQAAQPGYDALVGRYGFRNAFNLGRTFTGQFGHFPPQVIGLDLGPVAGSIENYESGFVWKLAMRNSFIQQGMQAAGFSTGPVEPFVLNFDDNPPAPQEDPNGGGQDPQSFGGNSYAFGGASVSYANIGDPFPNANYGPQQWALKIQAPNGSDTGAFTLLKNHSVSQWDRLSFWIRGEVGGESFSIGLKDSVSDRLGYPSQATEVKVPIATYHPTGGITNQWVGVQIPLRVFADAGVRLTSLDNLSFTNTGSGGTIYVDDIAFLGDTTAPQSPQGLTASADGVSVALNWTANPEPDVVGYRIQRNQNNGTFTTITPLLVVGTTYTDTSVSPGTYAYRLIAVDNAQPQNESAPSSAVSAYVNSSPGVFLSVSPSSVTAGQPFTITLKGTAYSGLAATWWFGQNTGITNANVVITYPPTPISDQIFTTPFTNPVKLDRAFGSPLFSAAQHVKSYTFTSTVTLTQPGTYTFGANTRDINGSQASEAGGLAFVTVVNHPPTLAPIANQTVNEGTPLTLTVIATDPDGDPLTYSASNLPAGASFTGRTLTWTPTLEQAGTYATTFTVSDGHLTDSKAATITVVDVPPTAPTNLFAKGISRSQIRLTWTDAAGETWYDLRRSTRADFSRDVDSFNLHANTGTFTDANLRRGRTYFYRLRACNTVGCSAYAFTSATTQ